MRTWLPLLILFLFVGSAYAQPNAWINELHYDNAGGDVGEFVEVVVAPGFTDFANLELVRYNGNGGSTYGSTTLDGPASNVNGFTIIEVSFPPNGLQNGSPDGVALCYNGSLVTSGSTVQFLSYEGTFTASGGCADGVQSTDIGIEESSSTQVGASIGLEGTGDNYDAFTWTQFGTNSGGAVNAGQTLLSAPSTTVVGFLEDQSIVMEGGSILIPIQVLNPSTVVGTSIAVEVVRNELDENEVTIGATSIAAGPGEDAGYIRVSTAFDANPEGAREIVFALTGVSGGTDAELGAITTHTLIVQDRFKGVPTGGGSGDDDGEAATPIAEARGFSVGRTVTVEGVVIRASGRLARVQDETAGIAVFSSSGDFNNAIQTGAIEAGTRLRVTGELDEFRGLLELLPTTFEIISQDNPLPEPQIVTLAEIVSNGEAYESELIQIRELTIDAMGDATFQGNANYPVTDPTESTGIITISTFGGDDVGIVGAPIPTGLAVFTGTLGQFDREEPLTDGYQLIPVDVTDIVPDDGGKATSTEDEQPLTFSLQGNYPNPFNPTTTVRFDLPQTADVRVEVYDLMGRQVMTTPIQTLAAGSDRAVQVDARALASGVYVYRLVADAPGLLHTATGRMMLVK